MAAISIKNLCKSFVTKESMPGFWGTVKGFFSPKRSEFQAIRSLSFQIEPGEKVAFIGPNGAGKSTTIKMLTGILYPTSGSIEVLGLVPWQNRHRLGYQIGTVFGQRTQLWYHLPPLDTFALLAKIYEIPQAQYKKRLQELIERFDLKRLLHKPVRQLSLGERMRCELVASLLHQPHILFLDEPTIGLDINAKLLIRDLLNQLSQEQKTTLFLTSHDTADIEQVCERVLILNQGELIHDSSIRNLKKNYIQKKILTLLTDQEVLPLQLPGIQTLEQSKHQVRYEVNTSLLSIEQVIQETLKITSIKDLTIEDLSMEAIIRELYDNKAQC